MEHHDETGDFSQENTQRVIDEVMAMLKDRPETAMYMFATLGSKTKMGGKVATATSEIYAGGFPIARVGDTIRYPDGTESKIISGAGSASIMSGQSTAIIGSAADNGDVIIDSPHCGGGVTEYANGIASPGFLQPGYVPPTDN